MTQLGNLDALQTTESRQQRLFQGACIGLGLLLAYFMIEAKTQDTFAKMEGLAIMFFAFIPSLQWIRSTEKRFPLVEVLMLTTANSYAFPILSGHEEVTGYPSETILISGLVVLAFQIAVFLTYNLVRGSAKRSSFWTDELMGKDAMRYLSYGVISNSIYLYVSDYTTLIPAEYDQAVRAVSFGISIVCTFITAQLWGAGQLKASEKSFFLINLLVQVVLQSVSLFLVGVVSTLLLAILGYVTSSRRVPFLACAIILPTIAVLHNGEPAMRNIYWDIQGNRLIPPISSLPTFYSQWVESGLNPPDQAPDDDSSIGGRLLQRTSLFQMVCLVAYQSPERLPYLDGDTYNDILAQLVPRILWPGKPSGLRGTFRLSIYYGLQDEEGTTNTSIAFGQVAEAYANFGFLGVIVLGSLTGLFYKKIQLWAAKSPIISYPGILLVVLMAWSFQTEFTLSTWISSLYQACACIFALLVVVKSFLR